MLRLPIPRHLSETLVLSCDDHNEFSVVGNIACKCGNNHLQVHFIGNEDESGSILVTKETEINEFGQGEIDFVLQVIAVCNACQDRIMVFDRRTHGWDGYIRDQSQIKDISSLSQIRHCPKCQHTEHIIEVEISNLGIEDFKINASEKPEEDWTEGFEWLIVNLECCNCGHRDDGWIDLECM
ncbi:MAG: hypothetical protein JNM67_09530 [Bacteroidetes bacterium]|nr:hypothetical protein [Bacteroidota bacterium]